MKSFTGKVIIITGGTAGIGRATAVAFAEQGANVVVAGRRDPEGAESVALIEKAGGKGLFVRTDVTGETPDSGDLEVRRRRDRQYFLSPRHSSGGPGPGVVDGEIEPAEFRDGLPAIISVFLRVLLTVLRKSSLSQALISPAGHTALIRTPCLPISNATDFVSPI